MTQPLFGLQGKRGLVVGIANDQSIAWGCARALSAAGAQLALTWLNDKARPHVEPLAQQLGAAITAPLDVSVPGQLEALFAQIEREWGGLDFLVHSIAFAPKQDLHGRVTDSSADGFAQAMDVSCHSFMRMAKLAEPLMRQGGSLMAMTYLGAEEVIADYGLMGPVKAALEASVRYLAAELGPGRHPRQCDFAGAAGHPRRLRHRPFRPPAGRRRNALADAPPGQYR